MDPLTNFVLLMVMGVLAAVCATLYKARAAPKFVLATDNSMRTSRSATIVDDVGGSAVAHYSTYHPATSPASVQRPPSWVGRPPGSMAKFVSSAARFEARRFPPPPGFLMASNSNGKKDRDRIIQRALTTKVMSEMVDEDLANCRPADVKRPAHRARVRFYDELVKTFEGVGDRDRALLLKPGIRSRLPPTHRHLVDQAFQEAYQPSAGA